MLKNETNITVFVSQNYDQVHRIVNDLESQGLNVIFSSEANKPYAVRVTTTLEDAPVALIQIGEAIAEHV